MKASEKIKKFGFRNDLMSREILTRDATVYINQKRAGSVTPYRQKSKKVSNE
jgi:hypothetical protein